MDTVQNSRPWDEHVLERLNAHVEAEREVLTEYALAAEKVEAPDVRYLIRLILEDERRHHRMFQELANAVQAAQEWRDLDPQVPPLTRRPLPKEERELATRLLAIEREDKRELIALRRDLRPVAETTLWTLLVALMELDTEKHERILQFIIDHSGA